MKTEGSQGFCGNENSCRTSTMPPSESAARTEMFGKPFLASDPINHRVYGGLCERPLIVYVWSPIMGGAGWLLVLVRPISTT